MSSLRINPFPWATCLLCLNSLKGLLSIRFMVTWFVITYTQLGSMLIEEIKTLQQHFRAAFDTVDHSILLNRLSSKLGANGTALDWFRFYLSSRSQWVSDRGAVSDKFDLRYGVPQCSRLGPLLFTVYAGALFDVVEKDLPTVHCYAYDSQLYISFSLKAHSGQADAVASIEHCIQDIRQWMCQDKLLMNDAKTSSFDRHWTATR